MSGTSRSSKLERYSSQLTCTVYSSLLGPQGSVFLTSRQTPYLAASRTDTIRPRIGLVLRGCRLLHRIPIQSRPASRSHRLPAWNISPVRSQQCRFPLARFFARDVSRRDIRARTVKNAGSGNQRLPESRTGNLTPWHLFTQIHSLDDARPSRGIISPHRRQVRRHGRACTAARPDVVKSPAVDADRQRVRSWTSVIVAGCWRSEIRSRLPSCLCSYILCSQSREPVCRRNTCESIRR